MRYVVKKELLWDSGLDIMGSRSPNMFLSRTAGPKDMELEMKAMTSLLNDYTASTNIITTIWPEGKQKTNRSI